MLSKKLKGIADSKLTKVLNQITTAQVTGKTGFLAATNKSSLFKTKSFYETCRNAGFDPNYVYEKMKKKILNQKMIWKMQKHGQRKSAILGVKIHD